MFSKEITLRVRYGETDQMGFVYYGNYAQYYEVGRVELCVHWDLVINLLKNQDMNFQL